MMLAALDSEVGDYGLAEGGQLGAHAADNFLHLLDREQLRVFFRQRRQCRLAAGEHIRNLLHHLGELAVQDRQQAEYHHHHKQHEGEKNEPHRNRPRHLCAG